jgi:hypothetical protein
MDEPIDEPTLIPYASGLCCMSVCADKRLTREEIERLANLQSPTGIGSPWKISSDDHFRAGNPNPCPCNVDGSRVHYLLNC